MHESKNKVVSIASVERPNPPIRTHFDDEEMARLIASIQEHGIAVPLLVRPRGDKFEIIDGDRRYHAAFSAGLKEVPVVVRNLNDSETHILRMLANKDRSDTDPVSEAKYIAHTVNEGSVTKEEWCEKMGRSEAWVSDRLEIAAMPEYIQVALAAKQITLGVALELNQVKDEETKERYFYDAMRSGMTVHAARISRMQVNEAIDALREQGDIVHKDNVPAPVKVPRAQCAYTGELLPVTAMRMVRVGIDNHERWQRELHSADSPIRSTPMEEPSSS